MGFLKTIERSRAKRRYARRLTPALHRMYGRRRYYKQEEIRAAAKREGLNIDYICWGYAMHLTPEDFNAYHSVRGETCSYEEMHREMVELSGVTASGESFGSGADFSVGDIGGGADGGGD